jgi:hypothetical protein
MSITTPLQPEDNGENSKNTINQNFEGIEDVIDALVVAGAPLATTTVKGRVKLSTAPVDADEPIAVGDNDTRLPDSDLQNALAGGGDFGTPSSANKFLTEDFLSNSPPEVVTFTSSGTWTKDAGLKYITLEQVAPGTNGQTVSTNTMGSGGRSGGYCKKTILASSLGSTESVTIGATTSFGSHTTSGSDGTATGGDINILGREGEKGGTYNTGTGGRGASSPLGIGGRGGGGGATENGEAASGYGAGGGGGIRITSGTGTGGAGSPGIVIVTEYYA